MSASGWALMYVLMMNSSRASPTPSLGMNESENASSGFPTFIITLVFGRASDFKHGPLDLEGKPPLEHHADVSLRARHRHHLAGPEDRRRCSVPTTAGNPSSRLTIAA